MERRVFLGMAAGIAVADPDPVPILDTHIHLYDPTRAQGIPWPSKDNKVLYRTVLPADFRKVALPLGVSGAIEVECSPWLEDNQWVLDAAAKDTAIVGMIGNLEPGKPDFRKHLERFRKNRLFLGIRCGYLWGRNLGADLTNPDFVAGLKALAEAGLTLDTANPSPRLLADVLRITDLAPALRVVVDHLPSVDPPRETLRELGKRRQVYVKVSEVLRRVDGRVSYDPGFYRPKLDELWETFGADRLLYGSDWPNSDP